MVTGSKGDNIRKSKEPKKQLKINSNNNKLQIIDKKNQDDSFLFTFASVLFDVLYTITYTHYYYYYYYYVMLVCY